MKVKRIRLAQIKIIQNDVIVYEGVTEKVDPNLLEKEIQQIDFENKTVVITI